MDISMKNNIFNFHQFIKQENDDQQFRAGENEWNLF